MLLLMANLTQKLANKDTTFHNLIRRPKHTINLFAGYQVTKDFFVSTSIQHFSKRNDIFYNPANFYTPEPKVLDCLFIMECLC